MGGGPTEPARQPSTGSMDLDLTTPAEDPSPPTRLSGPLLSAPYDPSQDREKMRGQIAGGLVVLLAFVVIVSFVMLCAKCTTSAELKDLLQIALGPIVALVGSATGFYFGGGHQPTASVSKKDNSTSPP